MPMPADCRHMLMPVAMPDAFPAAARRLPGDTPCCHTVMPMLPADACFLQRKRVRKAVQVKAQCAQRVAETARSTPQEKTPDAAGWRTDAPDKTPRRVYACSCLPPRLSAAPPPRGDAGNTANAVFGDVACRCHAVDIPDDTQRRPPVPEYTRPAPQARAIPVVTRAPAVIMRQRRRHLPVRTACVPTMLMVEYQRLLNMSAVLLITATCHAKDKHPAKHSSPITNMPRDNARLRSATAIDAGAATLPQARHVSCFRR